MEERNNIIYTLLIGVLSLFSVMFLWEHNFVLLFVLILLATLMLLINRSKQELKTFLFCSFFGATSEIFAVSVGVWNYTNPNILNIPIWLFVLWGIASVFMVRVYFFLKI